MTTTRHALVVLVPLVLSACKRPPPPSERQAWTPDTPNSDAAPPPRCSLGPGGARIGEGAPRGALQIGDAVTTPSGFAVGVVQSGRAGVALVAGDLASAPVVDLGPQAPDAAPPKPLARGDALYAIATGPSAGAGGHDAGATLASSIRVMRVARDHADLVGSVAQTADDSTALDAVLTNDVAVVVWDEDSPHHDRGVIKVASVPLASTSADAARKPVAAHIVSPDTSDADGPRLAPRANGFYLAWLARRAEPPSDAGPDDDPRKLEAPAERRAYQWVEIVLLSERGEALGAPRKVTSTAGHVGDFALIPHGPFGVDVIVRDDAQPSEGAGGRVLRITVRPEVDPPLPIAPDGAGRGALDRVYTDGEAWVAYDDTADHTHLLPFGPDVVPIGAPSLEPSLDRARLLALAKPSSAGAPSSLLVFVDGDERPLRLASCRR